MIQTFQVAQILTRDFPGFPIKIAIECNSREMGEVCRLYGLRVIDSNMASYEFEHHLIEVQFIGLYDYHEKEAAVTRLKKEAACLLSIAAPITSPNLKGQTVLEEYGHGLFIQEVLRGEHDAMGFNAPNEEGLIFPVGLSDLSLSDLKTPWLANTGLSQTDYSSSHHLYHMYIHDWTLQITALYSVINLERTQEQTIDLVMPCKFSLQMMLDSHALNSEYLSQFQVGTLVRVTPEGEEKISIGPGKTLRILSGPIQKEDMERIENNCQTLFGCTGDVSLTLAFLRHKIPFYEVFENKDRLLKSWIEMAAELGLSTYVEYLKLFANQIKDAKAIFVSATPPGFGHFASAITSVSLTDKSHVASTIIPKLTKLAITCGEQIVQSLESSQLQKEALEFDTYVQQNLNIHPRLLGRVARALLQANYPKLVEIEQQLLEKFKTGQLSEESLVDEFNSQLELVFSLPRSAP